ncbi:MAG: hypothetical protein AABY51_04975 [Deltaproteobacteria bacterium]
MEEFLNQIEDSYKIGHFYLALFCCLTLPDICGAISSDDGIATGQKYKNWFNTYVAPNYGGNFNGSNCYAFRCAALHQGRSDHRDLGYARIVFLVPTATNESLMHNNVLNDSLNLDVVAFCHDIVGAVRTWMRCEASKPVFQRNMATFLKRHEGGLEPYIVGTDVLS